MLAQDEALVRRVGAVSLGVLVAAAVFFVFIYSRIDWGSHIHVREYFHVTGGLAEGAPFVVGGREVGRVESIAPVPHGTKSPLGGDEGVVATVAIDSSVARQLHVGDVFVASRGTLSGKYLEIGAAEPGAPPLHAGDELVGRDPPSLDRVIQRTWDNLTTLGKFADDIRPELDALRTQIDALRTHAADVPGSDRFGTVADTFEVAAEIRQLREQGLGGPDGAARLSAVIAHARAEFADARGRLDALSASAEQLRTALAGARARVGTKGPELVDKVELAIDRVRAAIAAVDPLLAQIDELQASIARDDGSMLKLMHDPEFPEDAKELGKILKRHPWRVIDHPTK